MDVSTCSSVRLFPWTVCTVVIFWTNADTMANNSSSSNALDTLEKVRWVTLVMHLQLLQLKPRFHATDIVLG